MPNGNKIQYRNATLLLGSAMTVLAGATIAPALPAMSRAFQDIPNADFLVRMLLTVPALFSAIGAPFSGFLLDRWGRKPVLVVAVILYGLAGASGYVIGSLYGILASRALLGLAVAGTTSGFTTLIADYFSGRKLSKFLGYQAAFMAFGGAVFLLVGGILADIDWRLPFLLYLYAFGILLGVLFAIDEPQAQKTAGEQQSQDDTAAVPYRSVAPIYVLAFALTMLFFIGPVLLPFLLTDLGEISNSQIGLALAVSVLVGGVFSLQYQRLKQRLSFQGINVVVFLAIGLGSLIIGLSSEFAGIILGLVVSGIGVGLSLPNFNLWLLTVIPAAARGRAVGGLITAVFLGQFLSPIAIQPIASEAGFSAAFAVAGGISLLLGVVFLAWMILRPAGPTAQVKEGDLQEETS
ncbi:MAG: MFS transporter [Chloroflexi bacterium]|nr:MFS transporter [Chloroflexota bacterium]